MPAAAARRLIIRQASGWLIGLSESALPWWPLAVNNHTLTVRGDYGGSMYARSTRARCQGIARCLLAFSQGPH
jgi:hypothetical protein